MKKLLLLLLTVVSTFAFAQNVKPQWNENPSGSSETLKTQLVTSLESSIRITALAKPSAAGTVSGAGDYEYGSSCTLEATPAADYQFINWTKNGVTVSYSASYTFNVTEAATYVANFCGTQSNDVIVGTGNSTNSFLPTYSYYKYSFTEQIYTADELGEAGVITAVSFKVSNAKSTTRTVDLYLKSTTKEIFATKSDWEELSVADRMYSGNVTFNDTGWTTITLSKPFIYDGIHNLVIGMDDNTGSYVSSSSNSPKFYVYSTGANRALRIYGDNVNYTPAAPSGYNGSYILFNDQIMLAMYPIGDSGLDRYDITVTAEPEEGGVLTGDGTYEEGSVVTLSAETNEGYIFLNWTFNDEVVTTEPNYTFTVIEDREYVANFEKIIVPTYEITVAEVENGVITADKTEAAAGETVTLTVTPDEGCNFSHWIVYQTGDVNSPVSVNNNEFIMPEADVTVAALITSGASNVITEEITIGSGTATSSYLPTYSYYRYSLSEQIYTATEIGQAGTITAIAFKVSNSKTATRNVDIYMKTTDKNIFTNKTSWEPLTMSNRVYSGAVTFNASGWTVITLNTPFVYDGISNLLIGMDDNTGSYVSGGSNSPKFYVYHDEASRAIRIYSDKTNYDPASPESYSGTTLTSNNQIQLMMVTNEGGTVNDPTLFTTPYALADFTYVYGNGPSAAQSFVIVGSDLDDVVTVTAPDDYEISTTIDGTYGSTLTFGGERTRGSMVWDFEGTMDGWTSIDADGDGYQWEIASEGMSQYSHIPYHSGADMLFSESYNLDAGVALTPDNWLISPQVPLGGSFSIWACAQDANYPAEYFGIFVSTTSNTDLDSFVSLSEWTLSAKGTRDEGVWYQFSVDLGAYSGQQGYIAVRHFNCTDQFQLNVDDFMLTYEDTPIIPTPPPVHIDYLTANVYVRLKADLEQGSYDETLNVISGESLARVELNGAVIPARRDLVESKPVEVVRTLGVYPNPVACGESFRIAVPTEVSLDKASIEIYNELGVLVHTELFTDENIGNNLAAGLYTIRIVDTSGNVHFSKLIVK